MRGLSVHPGSDSAPTSLGGWGRAGTRSGVEEGSEAGGAGEGA